MIRTRAALVIESDPNAVAQMRRVLAGMRLSAFAASDGASLHEAVEYLQRKHMPVVLLVARVGLPSGSGIRLLEEAAAVFPQASQLVVSHYPKSLLFSVPRFLEHSDHFLQEEFTDEQFQRAVDEALGRTAAETH